MMRKGIYIVLKTFISLILFESTLLAQNKVDVGIFRSAQPDTLVIKSRPNYNLQSPWYITNIVFTIKWPDSSDVNDLITITSTVNSFFGLTCQQDVTYDGFRYKVYAVVGQKFVTWTAGQEYPIMEVAVDYDGGDCTTFEISNDTYTITQLNGKYYFEVVGSNKSGIRYNPTISLASAGGKVTVNDTICLGSNVLSTLSGQFGSVVTWQKKHNTGAWADITGTAGLTQYNAVPDSGGLYYYRAKVQRGSCEAVFSLPDTIKVIDRSIWTGIADTTWNNPLNWNFCGVPDISKDVEIPVVSSNFYPVILVNGNCKSLLIRNGASVRLSNTGTLNVGGTLMDNTGIQHKNHLVSGFK